MSNPSHSQRAPLWRFYEEQDRGSNLLKAIGESLLDEFGLGFKDRSQALEA